MWTLHGEESSLRTLHNEIAQTEDPVGIDKLDSCVSLADIVDVRRCPVVDVRMNCKLFTNICITSLSSSIEIKIGNSNSELKLESPVYKGHD